MLTGANFCPRGYADANGQLFPISQNTALFLFGTMYGGDGRSSFALPDLRSRSPMHIGTGPGLSPVTQGQRLGAEHTTVSIANMPAHTHDLNATSTVANTSSPGQDLLARGQFYANGPTNKVMGSTAIGSTGRDSNTHQITRTWLALLRSYARAFLFTQGQRLGAEHTTVSIANMPAHTHDLNATSTVANTSSPGQDLLARGQFYANGPTNKVMGSTAIGSTGGGTPIPTRSPALGLRYCVAMQGLFCSRN